eukprot:COSAG05_NODE_1479_length_4770_cov_4.525583_4_plen_175_part_00
MSCTYIHACRRTSGVHVHDNRVVLTFGVHGCVWVAAKLSSNIQPTAGALCSEQLAFLRGAPAFANVPDETRQKVADALTTETFDKGDVIIKKGTPGESFYMIRQGTVAFSVTDDHSQVVGRRGIREYFGEIALLQASGVTTATAIAETKCQCYKVRHHLHARYCTCHNASDTVE